MVAEARAAMVEASRDVLGGFELQTDALTVRYPNRFMDPRGRRMWNAVMGLMDERPPKKVTRRAAPTCISITHLPASP